MTGSRFPAAIALQKKRFIAGWTVLMLAVGLLIGHGTSFGGEKNPPGGAVGEPLPWSGSPKVEKLKEQYGTPVLMAAYRASLPIVSTNCRNLENLTAPRLDELPNQRRIPTQYLKGPGQLRNRSPETREIIKHLACRLL